MLKLFIAESENAKHGSEEFLKSLLRSYMGLVEDDLVILRDIYGKPYLRDFPNIHFNISHTKGAIICVIADNPVGVDIERIKPFNYRIVKKCFTKNEQCYIYEIEEKIQNRFFEIWTKKEAYVKWVGKGMEIAFDSIDVLSKDRISTKHYKEYIFSICK